MTLFMSLFSMTLSILIIILYMTIMKKTNYNSGKMSSFECGFNPISTTRNPFSLRFFILAILFLIFDVEISLLFPFPLSNINSHYILTSITFLTLLNLGLIYEWLNNSLEWK
uniref:NADH-ubiquinone oxidoreductase chain 3 n=1 Tax=Pseudocellus pearsei TaxID=58148 RepID=A9LI78_9ARAC|nr:NADH dehydrogenase subunit 3 [Pseudocellus pearsei]ABS71909.1 NADH dehydrogenase subunit 3 [Pseudocellus pearsei]